MTREYGLHDGSQVRGGLCQPDYVTASDIGYSGGRVPTRLQPNVLSS